MPVSVKGNITEVVLQTNAIKNIFTNGKSRNRVCIPKGFKNGIGYNTEKKPVTHNAKIVSGFKNKVVIMAMINDIAIVTGVKLGYLSNNCTTHSFLLVYTPFL